MHALKCEHIVAALLSLLACAEIQDEFLSCHSLQGLQCCVNADETYEILSDS